MLEEKHRLGWLVAVVLLVGFSVWIHYEVKVRQRPQAEEVWIDFFNPDAIRQSQPSKSGQGGSA